MSHLDPSTSAPDDCNGCPLARDRRQFLRDAATALAGIAVTLGIGRTAEALPVSAVTSLARAGARRSYAIPTSDGAQIDQDAEVILVRWQNRLYAFDLSCPHQHTALRWEASAGRFQCPKHHSKYQPDGEFISGRATRGMDRFPLAREGQNVAVDVDHMIRQDEDPNGWASAFLSLA